MDSVRRRRILIYPKALINNRKEVESYANEAKAIFQTKNQEEVLDTINVLYVALTRAEEQLYVISNKLKLKKAIGHTK